MPTPDAAVALVVPVVIPLLVFAGFFINAKYVRGREVRNHTVHRLPFRTIPNWLVWIKYLSWMYYTNEMGLVNQWEDVSSLECNQIGNSTCFRNGTDVLNYFSFTRVCERKTLSYVDNRISCLEQLQSKSRSTICPVYWLANPQFGHSRSASQIPTQGWIDAILFGPHTSLLFGPCVYKHVSLSMFSMDNANKSNKA